jgi:hypothetical protein
VEWHDRSVGPRISTTAREGATRTRALTIAAVLAALVSGVRVESAQDTPAPGASLAGTWRLDPSLSDHPQQIALALRINTGEADPVELFGQAARGAPGRGRGARGGAPEEDRSGQSAGSNDEEREADRKVLAELTEPIRVPPLTLTIAQAEAITITGAGKTPDVSSGRTDKYEVAGRTIERTATREGPTLVVTYDADDAGFLTYTYGLAPTTGQLIVRITVGRRANQPGPFVIKLVYNRAAPAGTGG